MSDHTKNTIVQTQDLLPDYSINNIDAIKRQENGHFFDAASMRFFHSRVSDRVYPTYGHMGTYFVTSERREYSYDCPRLYTIRRAYWRESAGGRRKLEIETVGEFQQYGSAKTAHRFAKTLAKRSQHSMIEVLRTAE